MGPFHLGIRQASNSQRCASGALFFDLGQSGRREGIAGGHRAVFRPRHFLGRRDSRGQQHAYGWLERAFEPEKSGICLALRHGLRMIGASILVPDPTAGNHLTPGPCVLMEYRNRGLGTALLEESLRQLRAAGLSRAAGLTKKTLRPRNSFTRSLTESSHPGTRRPSSLDRYSLGATPPRTTGSRPLTNDSAFALLDKADDGLRLFALPQFLTHRRHRLRGIQLSAIN